MTEVLVWPDHSLKLVQQHMKQDLYLYRLLDKTLNIENDPILDDGPELE
jgi:hypothetical protein